LPDPANGCVEVVTPQPFVFPACPADQGTFQMSEDRSECGRVEPSVVIHPATYRRVDKPRDVPQRLVVPGSGQPPIPDRLLARPGGLVTDRRQEAYEELPPAILGPPRPKRVAEEVELDVLMLAFPVRVLAVHDLGLLRMKLQTALP